MQVQKLFTCKSKIRKVFNVFVAFFLVFPLFFFLKKSDLAAGKKKTASCEQLVLHRPPANAPQVTRGPQTTVHKLHFRVSQTLQTVLW